MGERRREGQQHEAEFVNHITEFYHCRQPSANLDNDTGLCLPLLRDRYSATATASARAQSTSPSPSPLPPDPDPSPLSPP